MRSKNSTISHRFFQLILLLVLSTGTIQTMYAESLHKSGIGNAQEQGRLVLSSNGFNAQKPSSFEINGVKEHAGRGLTIIHFQSETKFEYRSFDTYGSPEEAAAFIETLEKIKKSNATIAVLAHDSASKSLVQFAENLKTLGFLKLSELASRQAYVMHNFDGKIIEASNDLSVEIALKIPTPIDHQQTYFAKISWDYEDSVDRYIAHAGGEVDGIRSTNTKEALDQNYKKGCRLFELDIIETTDGKLVAAHDWKMWARFTDYKGELPVSHAEFKKHKIYGKYTTMDFQDINTWFAAHPDALLVTDKVNDPLKFANTFVDKSRLIMELFSLMSIDEASKNGVCAMISEGPFNKIVGDKLAYLKINNIKYVALSRRNIARQTKLLLALKDQGVKVYVYNVNFDPGKDEKYVLENEIGLVYGMYADKWIFNGAGNDTSVKAK